MGIRVLIVEDSAPTRDTLHGWLDSMGGFEVVGTVASEMDATEWLQGHRGAWDLAILDLMIEGGSGFNLITRAARPANPGNTIVFSAYATPVVAQRCVALGAKAAFDKAQPDRLLAYLEALKSKPFTSRAKGPH